MLEVNNFFLKKNIFLSFFIFQKINFTLLWGFVLFFKMASSQNLAERWQAKSNKFVPLPLISFSPETDWAFGLSAQYIFRIKNDSLLRPSIVGVTTLYTLKNQFIFNPNWDIFFEKNKSRLTGAFVFQRYPDSFFGIGNDTKKNSRERFTSHFLLFKQRYLHKLKKNLFGGVQYRFEKIYKMRIIENSIFSQNHIVGRNGYTSSGLGFVMVYDNRDNVIFPFKGVYATLSHHYYLKGLGSDYTLNNISIDARYYLNIFGSHVLAFNGYGNFNFGTTPFKMLAQLGGPNVLRGYFLGRFRDEHLMIIQSEYRFPIYWRFIGVVFVGAGDVFSQVNDLDLMRLKIAGGGGLRFTLDAKERINLRFDFAFGRFKSNGFYVGITEAF